MPQGIEKLRGLAKGAKGAAPDPNPAPEGGKPKRIYKSGNDKRKEKLARAAAAAGSPPPAAPPPLRVLPPVPKPDPATEVPPSLEKKIAIARAFAVDKEALKRFLATPAAGMVARKVYSIPWAGLAELYNEPEVMPPAQALLEGGEALRWVVSVYMPNLETYLPLIGLGSCLFSDGIRAYAKLKERGEREKAAAAEKKIAAEPRKVPTMADAGLPGQATMSPIPAPPAPPPPAGSPPPVSA